MILIVLTVSLFTVLFALMPTDFFIYQTDYEVPTTTNKEVIDYFDANNITVYAQSWAFDLNYPGYAYNESGLVDGHRVEVFWEDRGSIGEYKILYFKHAFPGVLGDWWLDSAYMSVQEPYLTLMGEGDEVPAGGVPITASIDKTQLLRLSENSNSSYIIVSDGGGGVTQNFIIMNPGNYSSLSAAWDAGVLHFLSSYEVDFDAMKPNAFTIISQLVTFQNPDFGLPGLIGEIVGYGISLAFWIIIVLLIYTIVTGLIPTIRGGVEN